MKAHVTNLNEANGILTFTIDGVNVSVVNAIRRVLLAEVPTIIFRTTPYKENGATFHKNTTRFNNEILKQRLSCIPVHITANLTDDELAEYEVEIKGKNDGGNIEMVTTKDFRIQHQGKYLAKGAGGLRILHNYVTLGNSCAIETPPESYTPNKIGDIDLGKIQQQRHLDIQNTKR